MDKIRGRNSIEESADPFGDTPSSTPDFPSQPSQGNDSSMPPQEPFNSPFPGQENQQQPQPFSFDSDNPDLNSQMGFARPQENARPDIMQSPPPQQSMPENKGHMEKDIQIVLAKLDAIKSELDSLHQRIQKIEKIAEQDSQAAQKKSMNRW